MAYHCNLALKFAEVVRGHRARPALRQMDGEITSYAELEELANRIAQLLIQRGWGRGDVVAIFNDKSVAAFATMLACLKTGLIYTNLDPDSPWERVRKILETCQPAVI